MTALFSPRPLPLAPFQVRVSSFSTFYVIQPFARVNEKKTPHNCLNSGYLLDSVDLNYFKTTPFSDAQE